MISWYISLLKSIDIASIFFNSSLRMSPSTIITVASSPNFPESQALKEATSPNSFALYAVSISCAFKNTLSGLVLNLSASLTISPVSGCLYSSKSPAIYPKATPPLPVFSAFPARSSFLTFLTRSMTSRMLLISDHKVRAPITTPLSKCLLVAGKSGILAKPRGMVTTLLQNCL